MNIKIILVASFGAAVLELIYWNELRQRLESRRYRRLVRSWEYWIQAGLFIVASGFGTWIWYGMEQAGQMSQDPRDYLLVGAAFPSLVKGAIRSLGSSKSPPLGAEESSVWGDYFQTRPIR